MEKFSNYKELEEKLHAPVYFADSYCSWKRGTNENTNGFLREYIPKRKRYSDIYIRRVRLLCVPN